MPFKSKRQMRYLFSQKPKVARKFVRDARRAHKPVLNRTAKRKKRK